MDKTKIDWCDMSWNPITGCKHDCEYCYARRMAARFGGYDYGTGVTTNNPLPRAELTQPLIQEFPPELKREAQTNA